jgi:hypothetical protein
LNPCTLFSIQREQAEKIFEAPEDERGDLYDQLKKEARENSPQVETLGQWTIEQGRIYPALVLTLDDGTVLRGTFKVRNGKAKSVEVEIIESEGESGEE